VPAEKTLGEVLRELKDLLVGYARQETVEPFHRLAHYLKFGLPGAISLTLGLFFLSLGILRGLQHLSWTTTGFGSLVPYLGMIVFQIIVLVVCALKIRASMAGGGVGASAASVPPREREEPTGNVGEVSEVTVS
jgi:hypothetical protein